MGFLDGSTNSIILDCALTDIGRQALSRNDGSFSIVKFALGDDEVDYSIIRKYGRVVGKEKIEKNTPVLEALTNQNLGQKYRCISISNANLIRLPSFSLVGENVSSDILSLGAQIAKTSTITISQTIQNESSIDVELRDQAFVVTMNNDFLQIQNTSPDNVDGTKNAKYVIVRDPVETSLGGSKITFTLQTKSISAAQFTIFGTTSNKNIISTIVRVYGLQSGASKDFTVNINKLV